VLVGFGVVGVVAFVCLCGCVLVCKLREVWVCVCDSLCVLWLVCGCVGCLCITVSMLTVLLCLFGHSCVLRLCLLGGLCVIHFVDAIRRY
jgi:hypothetical protein